MLEEMRDARLRGRLVTRSGADPEPEGNRADRGHRLGHDPDAGVELCELVALPSSHGAAPVLPAVPGWKSTLSRGASRADVPSEDSMTATCCSFAG